MCSYVDSRTTTGELVDHSEQIEALDTAPTKEWEVESILDEIGSVKSGNKRYLVKWKGYYENSWEPEKSANAPDLITDFHTKKHKSFNASRDTDVPVCAGGRAGPLPHAHARASNGSGHVGSGCQSCRIYICARQLRG